jgi:23S rRNA pseudouridine1911/1915/1917 synthase
MLPPLADPADPGTPPEPIPLRILYEDDALLVVDKPAGMLVHPVGPLRGGTLANGLAHHLRAQGLPGRVHLVQRLDRDTSGVIAVAKRSEIHRLLDRQLRSRRLHRRYLALVAGAPPESGTIDGPIGRNPDDPPLRAVRPEGQPATTRFRVVERYHGAALVELELETGRTHQIRVHLEHLGHPVLGDRWYGRAGLDLVQRQALHAAELRLEHPVTGLALRVESPLPEDLEALREQLR